MVAGCFCFFFFNDTATTEIYTLSLHDALPICDHHVRRRRRQMVRVLSRAAPDRRRHRASHLGLYRGRWSGEDRKSTRLNSSHANISYAVFCLKKKNTLSSKSTFTTPLYAFSAG